MSVYRIYGGSTTGYVLTVPKRFMHVLTADMAFVAELTDEGLLYRYVGNDYSPPDDPPDDELPAWVKEAQA